MLCVKERNTASIQALDSSAAMRPTMPSGVRHIVDIRHKAAVRNRERVRCQGFDGVFKLLASRNPMSDVADPGASG